ncbi:MULTISPECIES: alpha/beta fold hydrolase [unclassified Crossiella]|uniref:alpha/beta fold hydrolase n=1 Tax=unclassified Crossiella TaxID=2620835 RepID=UPI001FFF5570|nr:MULTISPECIES: alpha/beta hydrolase [unclassified Crossiella]MCK2244205.1 alpha/beta hydrolase [Crossiella sp. S99.2]MCK2258009.1 alpha/beta hydrolase [Crossiella sp. S99.1]
MSPVRTGVLRVPGAGLHYAICGSGPPLVILPGGGGDADCAGPLTETLAADFTVLTYDRRGQTRTTVDDPVAAPGIRQHAADVHGLLTGLGLTGAVVFGSSTGAVIGLDLVRQHPDLIRRFVAHEPPLPSLLDAEDRAAVHGVVGQAQRLHRTGGWQAVFRRMSQVLEVPLTDHTDRTAEVAWSPPTRRTSANLNFFLTNDFGATWEYQPDEQAWAALREAATVITPAVRACGTGRETLLTRSTLALAEVLGTATVELPGGHDGYRTHPYSFAAALREVLAG